MTYLVSTIHRNSPRRSVQGGIESLNMARAVAAQQLQDQGVAYAEIHDEASPGVEGVLVETITRD